MQIVTVKYQSFSELPMEQVVELARREQYVEIQVSGQAVWTANKNTANRTLMDTDSCIAALREQLIEHAVWNKGFLPYETVPSMEPLAPQRASSAGNAQISIWRFGNEQEVAELLDVLMEAVILYRDLANILMRSLAQQLNADIAKFANNNEWQEHKSRGMLEEKVMGHSWGYFFHGYDCCFGSEGVKTRVEARLGLGNDFGIIERHFFWEFLSSYVRKEPKFSPVVERIHKTKQAWVAQHTPRDKYVPDILPFLLTMLERRGLLRCITTYDDRSWDWLVIDKVCG